MALSSGSTVRSRASEGSAVDASLSPEETLVLSRRERARPRRLTTSLDPVLAPGQWCQSLLCCSDNPHLGCNEARGCYGRGDENLWLRHLRGSEGPTGRLARGARQDTWWLMRTVAGSHPRPGRAELHRGSRRSEDRSQVCREPRWGRRCRRGASSQHRARSGGSWSRREQLPALSS